MLFVDDHLARVALSAKAPDLWQGRMPNVSWVFYLRLVTALLRSNVAGQHSRHRTEALIDAVKRPHAELLRIADFRDYIGQITSFCGRTGISVAAAELLGIAVATQSEMHVAELNVTDAWRECLKGSSVKVFAYSTDELDAADAV